MYILLGIPGGRSCTLAACYLLHLTVICTYRKEKPRKTEETTMKKNITKEEEKALLEIAKRLMAAVDSRGDLEARDNDSEDFIEVPVWGIQKAMEEAYLLGRMTR